jgi:acyl carrier protein
MAPPSQAEILRQIQQMMKELFELDPGRVQLDARLIEDLELDSLDAIDLAVKVEETTGLVFDEVRIRQLRTIKDVMVAIESMLSTEGATFRTLAPTPSDP